MWMSIAGTLTQSQDGRSPVGESAAGRRGVVATRADRRRRCLQCIARPIHRVEDARAALELAFVFSNAFGGVEVGAVESRRDLLGIEAVVAGERFVTA